MTPFVEKCTNDLWSDLSQDDLFPFSRPMLAHYTSVETLAKIMINNELWLSHPLLMNDDQEMKWGFVEGQTQFRNHSGLRQACDSASLDYNVLAQAFEKEFDEFATTHAYDIYITCFCKHDPDDTDGLLSMWRGYGSNGGGAAIVFDTGKLVAVDDSPLVLAPVVYASTAQRQQWVATKLDSLATAIQGEKPSHDELQAVASAFVDRLKIFALFTKHTGFSEEREWRLVYMSDRDPKGLYQPMLSYAVSPNGVSPKFKLPLRQNTVEELMDLSITPLVSLILIGPTAGDALSVMAIKRMLTQAGKPELVGRVKTSSTPFRN